MREAGGEVGGEHATRCHEDGADAAVRGLPQRDLHAVHLRESSDDGHAEPGRLAHDVRVYARRGQPEQLLDLAAGLVAEADAAVLDLDGDAGLHLDRGDVHLGVGR